MATRTDLEFAYEPSDFFDGARDMSLRLGTVRIDAGRAVLTLAEPTDPVPRAQLEDGTRLLRDVFDAQTFLTGRTASLSRPNVVQHTEHGRNVVLFPESAVITLKGENVHLQVHDSTGRLIRDTRVEQQQREAEFLRVVALKAPASRALRGMLGSYSQSIADPANEFVHLYEICEAAYKHFGNQSRAKEKLGVTPELRRLHYLANGAPVTQGRHRGQHVNELRPATAAERAEAQSAARQIIIAFANAV